ncbi:UNKNOWN [Stylonychia lemnae]|uniref:Transmembrane protein n=1 Tax=Stylonychia lemnae TaxID=5949 RepID=A0A078AVS6_STYLE|nr:UNKNOWN [Stylonychia lemnae]|eukprot:CDW86525.1 UNKNOWN [Stylonychia lemnae]
MVAPKTLNEFEPSENSNKNTYNPESNNNDKTKTSDSTEDLDIHIEPKQESNSLADFNQTKSVQPEMNNEVSDTTDQTQNNDAIKVENYEDNQNFSNQASNQTIETLYKPDSELLPEHLVVTDETLIQEEGVRYRFTRLSADVQSDDEVREKADILKWACLGVGLGLYLLAIIFFVFFLRYKQKEEVLAQVQSNEIVREVQYNNFNPIILRKALLIQHLLFLMADLLIAHANDDSNLYMLPSDCQYDDQNDAEEDEDLEQFDPKEDDYDSDVYIFNYEDKALEQYKGIHPGNNEDAGGSGGLKYSCPETGAHFEIRDISKRLQYVQKLRACLDEAWGLNQAKNQETASQPKNAKAQLNQTGSQNRSDSNKSKNLSKYLSQEPQNMNAQKYSESRNSMMKNLENIKSTTGGTQSQMHRDQISAEKPQQIINQNIIINYYSNNPEAINNLAQSRDNQQLNLSKQQKLSQNQKIDKLVRPLSNGSGRSGKQKLQVYSQNQQSFKQSYMEDGSRNMEIGSKLDDIQQLYMSSYNQTKGSTNNRVNIKQQNPMNGIISQRKSAAMPGINLNGRDSSSNTKSPTMNLSQFKGESPNQKLMVGLLLQQIQLQNKLKQSNDYQKSYNMYDLKMSGQKDLKNMTGLNSSNQFRTVDNRKYVVNNQNNRMTKNFDIQLIGGNIEPSNVHDFIIANNAQLNHMKNLTKNQPNGITRNMNTSFDEAFSSASQVNKHKRHSSIGTSFQGTNYTNGNTSSLGIAFQGNILMKAQHVKNNAVAVLNNNSNNIGQNLVNENELYVTNTSSKKSKMQQVLSQVANYNRSTRNQEINDYGVTSKSAMGSTKHQRQQSDVLPLKKNPYSMQEKMGYGPMKINHPQTNISSFNAQSNPSNQYQLGSVPMQIGSGQSRQNAQIRPPNNSTARRTTNQYNSNNMNKY